MIARADGRLRHCFFGTYGAVIVLAFRTAKDAAAALPVLGGTWCPGKNANALIWSGSAEELRALKLVLAGFGADAHAIDSVDHSIDYGDSFHTVGNMQGPGDEDGARGPGKALYLFDPNKHLIEIRYYES